MLEKIIEYYKNLLIIQYHNKVKARETVAEWVKCMSGDALFLQLQNAFDIDKAVGAQLDLIGKFVGLQRNALNDDKYKILLKMKILRNNIFPSMKNIDDALYDSFGSLIVMNNDKDMSITYIVDNNLSDIAQILIDEDLLPTPLGVDTTVILKTNPSESYFGFKRGDVSTSAVGFSSDGNKQEAIWLSSDNII